MTTSQSNPTNASHRGVTVFPILLGLCALIVAGLVGAHELAGYLLPWHEVAVPLMIGAGVLLGLIGGVGLLSGHRSRHRRDADVDAPSV